MSEEILCNLFEDLFLIQKLCEYLVLRLLFLYLRIKLSISEIQTPRPILIIFSSLMAKCLQNDEQSGSQTIKAQ